MENKFKVRISRMFHNSCKSRDDAAANNNIVDKSPFFTRSTSMPAAPLAKPLPLPSICKPRTPPSLHINRTCIISSRVVNSFVPLTHKNRASPGESKSQPKLKSPVSPVKQLTYSPIYARDGTSYYAVEYDCGKKKNKGKALPSSDDHDFDHDFFCGDDEKEDDGDEDVDDERTMDTLFSSRSHSSSKSSENRCRMRSESMSRPSLRRIELSEGSTGVRGSFVVVKKSRDPYGDFRKSMVEMITERRIFDEEELEQLLLCFLSLNSSHHHKIIIQVFNEIWDALH